MEEIGSERIEREGEIRRKEGEFRRKGESSDETEGERI